MHIIIEGQDRCGKTSLTQELIKYLTDKPIQQLHYTAFKCFDKKQDCIKYSKSVYKQMFKFLKSNKTNYILDRAHLGEYVYGYLYRKYTEKQARYIFKLEEILKVNENKDIALIVLADSSNERLNREDGKSISNDNKTSEIEFNRFKAAYGMSIIPNKIFIDIAGKDFNTVLNEVKSFLKFN